MSLIFGIFRKSATPDAAFDAYRSIVAQSRQVKFYADWGVADTVTGRFDMISLHLALLLHRLRDDPQGQAFGQSLVELFFRDMDRSLRELGVTDLGVPRKVKKMGDLFYGLARVLGEALDHGSAPEIESVLVRNVYGAPSPGAALLAAYLLEERARLAAEPMAAIVNGQHAAGVAA
jgi:cytochrome b pre-mRNA-processing protein 3